MTLLRSYLSGQFDCPQRKTLDRIVAERDLEYSLQTHAGPYGNRWVASFTDGTQVVIGPDGEIVGESER